MKITRTVGGIALSLGIGCAGAPATPTPTPAEVNAAIEADLARLSALDVVNAYQLVLKLPAEATACYGVPCPGSEWQAAYDTERARQAARLDKLVAVAENAVHNQQRIPPMLAIAPTVGHDVSPEAAS